MKYLKYLKNYIFSFFYDLKYLFFGSWRIRIGDSSYYKASKLYSDYLKKGNAVETIKYLALEYCKGRGVDIGASQWPLEGARPILDKKEENAYKINKENGMLDFVFSSHVIEHLNDWQVCLREWHRTLKKEGILFLYLPHPICKMWEVGINKSHLWQPEPQVVADFLTKELKMSIRDMTYTPDIYMSFYIIAKK